MTEGRFTVMINYDQEEEFISQYSGYVSRRINDFESGMWQ